MDRLLKITGRIAESPYCAMFAGCVLVFTGLWEIWGTVWDDLSHFRFRLHHGIIIYGVFTILKSVPHLHEGLRHLNRKRL